MVSPDFVRSIRPVLENNMNNHITFKAPAKKLYGRMFCVNGAYEGEDYYEGDEPEDEERGDCSYVNVVYIDGPITRNGDACSYGSKDMRDQMMRAAEDKNCLGHIFYINTPGGVVDARDDFQLAIDYAHDKHQPVLGFVDGDCLSMGMYLACMCDEVYYMHPHNSIGCIGVLAAYYTLADGAKNTYTQETYHEIYDPESFDKNRQTRDLANEGKTDLWVQELSKLGSEFRAFVKQARPKATDEHLHGKIFEASEVEGIFVDGQSTMNEVIDRVVALAQQQATSKSSGMGNNSKLSNKNNKAMNKNYERIAQLLGVDELVVTTEGTHLDVSLLDKATENLEALDAIGKERDQLKAQVATLQKQLDEATQASQANVEAETARVEALNQQVETLNVQITTLNADVEARQQTIDAHLAEIERLNGEVSTLNQRITDQQSQIEELTSTPGAEPATGGSPATNGQGAKEPHLEVGMPEWDCSKSPTENARIREEYEKARQSMISVKQEL